MAAATAPSGFVLVDVTVFEGKLYLKIKFHPNWIIGVDDTISLIFKMAAAAAQYYFRFRI